MVKLSNFCSIGAPKRGWRNAVSAGEGAGEMAVMGEAKLMGNRGDVERIQQQRQGVLQPQLLKIVMDGRSGFLLKDTTEKIR